MQAGEFSTREGRALALLQVHAGGCLVCYRAGAGNALKDLLCKKGRALRSLLELTRKKYENEETENA